MSTLCTSSTTTLCSSQAASVRINSSAVQARSQGEQRSSIQSKLSQWFSNRWQSVVIRHRQRINRQAFQNLLTLDDHMLKDIGVSRGDVQWANSLPLSQDAATELAIIARRRKS